MTTETLVNEIVTRTTNGENFFNIVDLDERFNDVDFTTDVRDVVTLNGITTGEYFVVFSEREISLGRGDL